MHAEPAPNQSELTPIGDNRDPVQHSGSPDAAQIARSLESGIGAGMRPFAPGTLDGQRRAGDDDDVYFCTLGGGNGPERAQPSAPH